MLVEQMLPRASERPAVIDAGASIRDAAGLMTQPATDLIVVCRGGAVTGVVTKTDIVVQSTNGDELTIGGHQVNGFPIRCQTVLRKNARVGQPHLR